MVGCTKNMDNFCSGSSTSESTISLIEEYVISEYIVDADGSTPYTDVQSAIDTASLTGRVENVFIRPGTYAGFVLKNNINVIGISEKGINITSMVSLLTAGSYVVKNLHIVVIDTTPIFTTPFYCLDTGSVDIELLFENCSFTSPVNPAFYLFSANATCVCRNCDFVGQGSAVSAQIFDNAVISFFTCNFTGRAEFDNSTIRFNNCDTQSIYSEASVINIEESRMINNLAGVAIIYCVGLTELYLFNVHIQDTNSTDDYIFGSGKLYYSNVVLAEGSEDHTIDSNIELHRDFDQNITSFREDSANLSVPLFSNDYIFSDGSGLPPGTQVFTLPSNARVGDTITIMCIKAFLVDGGAVQFIKGGVDATSSGGAIVINPGHAKITLVCSVEDTEWIVSSITPGASVTYS